MLEIIKIKINNMMIKSTGQNYRVSIIIYD